MAASEVLGKVLDGQATWILRMEEESVKGGQFLTMKPNDDKQVQFLTEQPEEGINEFEGKSRPEFKFSVRDMNTKETISWAVRQKEVMQQLIAIMKLNHLMTLKGCILDVSTRGPDSKTKHWFLRLISLPGQAQDAPQQARPAPIPVSEADREASFQARQGKAPVDPQGAAWLEGQKSGLSQAPSAAEQGAR
jgi:hypothetical protein